MKLGYARIAQMTSSMDDWRQQIQGAELPKIGLTELCERLMTMIIPSHKTWPTHYKNPDGPDAVKAIAGLVADNIELKAEMRRLNNMVSSQLLHRTLDMEESDALFDFIKTLRNKPNDPLGNS